MGSGVDVDSEGGANVDFEHVAAAARTFSKISCCISSLLRAFRDTHSPEFPVWVSASCLFGELLDSVRGLMVFGDPF